MTAKLSKHDEVCLGNASTEGIVKHLGRVGQHTPHGRWLGVRNVYRSDPITRIKAASDTRDPRRHWPLQLADYVAASAPLHLWDGWNYLGLAFHSYIRGSADTSTHLAYYAELRAAMALLSSQGIGVFGDQHYVVEKNGAVSCLSQRGTHQATWLYLKYWAQQREASSLLGQILRMQSRPVTEWLLELRGAGAWQPLGSELLIEMGLDLKRMTDDRIARNEASYRPTGFATRRPSNPQTDANYMVEMIRLLEPGGSRSSFEVLDQFMFRRIVERAVAARGHRAPLGGAVTSMVAALVEHPARQRAIERFLARKSQPLDPPLVREALSKHDRHHANFPLQVMGRAMLLLRVATGAVRGVLGLSSLSVDSLRFWWQEAGRMQGFWDTSASQINGFELWEEIDEALDSIDDWIESDGTSRRDLLTSCALPLMQTTGMARFALMGLSS